MMMLSCPHDKTSNVDNASLLILSSLQHHKCQYEERRFKDTLLKTWQGYSAGYLQMKSDARQFLGREDLHRIDKVKLQSTFLNKVSIICYLMTLEPAPLSKAFDMRRTHL